MHHSSLHDQLPDSSTVHALHDVGNLVAECAPLEASELPASQQQSTRCTRFAKVLTAECTTRAFIANCPTAARSNVLHSIHK